MITVEKCLPKQNGEGMQLSGTNSRGGKWYLWQINGKYDMFSNSENPPVEEGKEYDLDIKEKTTEKNGKTYKNYTASFKTEASKKADEVMEQLKKINDRLDKLALQWQEFTKIFSEKQ
jgi:predicted RNA-binding protein with TRAM domain